MYFIRCNYYTGVYKSMYIEYMANGKTTKCQKKTKVAVRGPVVDTPNEFKIQAGECKLYNKCVQAIHVTISRLRTLSTISAD